MDATQNEHPKMPIQGFPTIRLFKPGQSEPLDYAGDRSLEDLIKFVEKETRIELQIETDHKHHHHPEQKATTEEL